MKPVKIAQVGYGHDHAKQTFDSIRTQPEYFELVGVCEPDEGSVGLHPDPNFPNPECRGKVLYPEAPHYTLQELLAMDDLEAVAIETEECLATGYAQRFAEKGVAVHMDKPGAQDMEAFARLVETMRAHGKIFQMGYMYRYNPLIRKALDMARSGELGEIFSVETQMSVRHVPEKRKWLSQFKGGMMFFLGCHLVDLVLQAQGLPEQVIPLNACTGDDCGQAEDYGFAVLRYPKGVSFVKTCATEFNGYARRQLVITGTKGSVEIKPLEEACPEGIRTTAYFTLQQDAPHSWKQCAKMEQVAVNRYDEMMRSFARKIRGEEEQQFTYDYELALFRTIMQCCQADV